MINGYLTAKELAEKLDIDYKKFLARRETFLKMFGYEEVERENKSEMLYFKKKDD